MHRLRLIVLILIATMALAACGGSPSTADAPTAETKPTEKPAATPRPTREPRPTAEPKPTSAPKPTKEPTAEPEPTEEPSGDLMELTIDELETYTHDGGLFTIDVPSNWEIKDNSKDGEAIVLWTDPSGNGFVTVDILETDQELSEEELTTMLENFVSRFNTEEDFSQDPAETQESGSVRQIWSYTASASNGVKAKILGNSFIRQEGNKISIFTLVVPDDQFDTLSESLDAILNSYTFDPSVALGAEPAGTGLKEVQIGDLETYTHADGLFSIDIPNNWTVKDNSKAGEAIVLWNDPTQNGLIVVDVFQKAEAQSEDQLVSFLQDFLNNSFSSETDFNMDPPKPQTDGSVLIVWSYTAEASGGVKSTLLGNSFIEQREDKVSILSTLVPQEQFETLLPSTNKIINSYRLDPSADLP